MLLVVVIINELHDYRKVLSFVLVAVLVTLLICILYLLASRWMSLVGSLTFRSG